MKIGSTVGFEYEGTCFEGVILAIQDGVAYAGVRGYATTFPLRIVEGPFINDRSAWRAYLATGLPGERP